jgi:hypothetical protein
MKRRISARNPRTRLYPAMLAAAVIGVAVSYFVILRLEAVFGNGPAPVATAIVLAGFWTAIFVADYRWRWKPLKCVAVDEQALYVSEYGESVEVTIPVADIARVTQSRGRQLRPVTIHLSSPSPFGQRIMFQPELRAGWAFREDPIVGELRQLRGQPQGAKDDAGAAS